jgi:hypothetical protein
MKRIKDARDFWSGVMFIGFGLAAVILGRVYPFGTAAEMGPGFFPTILGCCLAFLGLIAVARSMRPGKAEAALGTFAARPAVVILGSIMSFGFALPKLGLVVASMLVMVLSRLAAPGFKTIEVFAFGAVLTAICTLAFAWGLKLPILIWPAFLVGA